MPWGGEPFTPQPCPGGHEGWHRSPLLPEPSVFIFPFPCPMMAIWAWARCRVPQAASSNTAIKLQDACNLFVISSTTSPPAACERGRKYFPLRRMDATFPRLNCQVNRFSFANVVRLCCYYFKNNKHFTPPTPVFFPVACSSFQHACSKLSPGISQALQDPGSS